MPDHIHLGDVTARRSHDGTIALANGSVIELLTVGASQEMRVLARRGPGPGELSGPFELQLVGDTLLAIGIPPRGGRAVRKYHVHRGHLQTVRPMRVGGRPLSLLGQLGNAWAVARTSGIRELAIAGAEPPFLVDSTAVGLCKPTAEGCENVTWLPEFITEYLFTHPWPRGPVPRAMAPYHFRPRTLVAVSGDYLWLVDAVSGQVRAYDERGVNRINLALPWSAEPVSRKELEEKRAADLDSASSAVDSARAIAGTSRGLLPPHRPFANAIVSGVDGEVWLRVFETVPGPSAVYARIARDGTVKGRIRVPQSFKLQQVASDVVLVVSVSLEGDETVGEYSLPPGVRR
ncbi:MAG: hypothetical protein ACT4P7_10100 [Gemmatimonadaceae bacterium]